MGRKFVSTFVVAIIILSGCSTFGNVQNQCVYVRFESVSGSSNHVGNEWTYEVYVNGESLRRGQEIEACPNVFGCIAITAIATESDTYPDVGRRTKRISIKNIPADIQIPVSVREDRGRYAGNIARWVFQFAVRDS